MRWIRNRRKAIENWLGPVPSGLIEGLMAPVVVALLFWGSAESLEIGDPSASTFRDLGQIGAAFFVAFAVATAGASAFTGGNLKEHLGWLGVTCGIGISGLLAIGASVALAAFREAGHSGWIDILGLSWIGSSLLLLGSFVAGLPYAAYSWSKAESGR